MPTLQEIVDAPKVAETDGYDVTEVMNRLIQSEGLDVMPQYSMYEEYRITLKQVVSVYYDHRRGAATYVLYYKDNPFAIVSCAGRELDDTVSSYLLDRNRTELAVAHFCTPKGITERSDIYNMDADISLEFWENTPVELGDVGRKGYLLGY